jgi:hypothetical protein
MKHINPTCPHATKVNASAPHRAARHRGRRHGVLLAYDGVTAAYIRDISTRAGSGQPDPDELEAAERSTGRGSRPLPRRLSGSLVG